MDRMFTAIELDHIYRLRLTMGAITEFEQVTGKKLMDITGNRPDMLLRLLWVMLRQENQTLTLNEAMKLVRKTGRIDQLLTETIEAINAAFPTSTDPSPDKIKSEFQNYNKSYQIALSQLGIKPDEFRSMTPIEYSYAVDGYIKNFRREHNEKTAAAWHAALWGRVKHNDFPSLKSVLIEEESAPKRKQTDDEMMNACKLLCAVYGGKEVRT